jgi:predicted esterase
MSMTRLIGLHGFTQNGAQLRSHMDELLVQLPTHIAPVFADAPHVCSQQSVERLYAMTGGTRLPPPHLCWWDASDDGRVYHGWEASCERLRDLASTGERVGVLGFSQGAMVAAAIAALADRGDFPPIAFAILIAGRVPRAEVFQSAFERPLRIPSLHLWGEQDAFARAQSPALAECFEAQGRERVLWHGPHVVPTRGPGAEAVRDFITRHASA